MAKTALQIVFYFADTGKGVFIGQNSLFRPRISAADDETDVDVHEDEKGQGEVSPYYGTDGDIAGFEMRSVAGAMEQSI